MRDHETRNLKVILTETELQKKGQELAQCNQGIAEKKAHKKEVSAQIDADIKKFELQVLSLSRAIQNGFEYRDVECVWLYEWASGKKRLIRRDTAEEIDCKSITEAERQQHIDFERAEKKKAMRKIDGGKSASPGEDHACPRKDAPCE